MTQSRLAVDVSDPVGLAHHLEGLTGAEDFEGLIQQHSSTLEQLAGSMEGAQQAIGRYAERWRLVKCKTTGHLAASCCCAHTPCMSACTRT